MCHAIENGEMERRFFMIIMIFADKESLSSLNHNHHNKSAFHFLAL